MSTFQKIGDRIEVLAIKLDKTIAELEKGRPEDYPGREDRLLGNATISGWIDKDISWTSSVLEKFLTYWKVSREWWKTGQGEVFITSEQKTSDNKEKAGRETFYRDLIETNADYSLIPRAVLHEYKIIPEKILEIIINSKDNEKISLIEKYDLVIAGYKNKIERLEGEKADLEKQKEDLQRQIPTKTQ